MDENLENSVDNEVEETETVEPTETETPKVEATQETETPKTQTLEFWKEASRKHELNNKTNLKKFKEAEDALNKVLEEREQLTTQLAELQTQTKTQSRLNIQLKFGLSDLIASRLVGETAEELEADAQVWVQEVQSKKEEAKKPNIFQGNIENKMESGTKSIFQQQLGN